MKRSARLVFATLSIVFAFSALARAADGLIAVKSARSVAQTVERFEEIAKQRDLKIFARIDHAAGAGTVDKKLRPTTVVIFGNPKGGTPLMECAQSAGIDLPLKALVWEDANAQVWVGYNDPAWLARRHAAANCPVVANLQKVLADLSAAVVAP